MKYLAAEADARWEAKPRVMEAPREEQERLPLAKERAAPADEASAASPQAKKTEKADENDPWARAKAQGPGEKWQPTAWNPAATKRNR